jgi:hypothetical protein
MPNPQIIRELGQVGGALLVVIGFLFFFLFLLSKKIDKLSDRISGLPAELARALSVDREENRKQIDRLFNNHIQDSKHTLSMIREVVDGDREVMVQVISTLQAFKAEVKAEIREIHLRMGWEKAGRRPQARGEGDV